MDDSQDGQIINLDATGLPSVSLFVSADQIPAVTLQQPPIITVMGEGGAPLVAVHPDGHLEYGDGYEPDDAARRFWDGVEQCARTIQYGGPLNESINAHLKAGQEAEQRVAAITEAVILWRDRPGGDVGLAIALASILDMDQPEPPAATALVRVLRECDTLMAQVSGLNPSALAGRRDAVARIREAAGPAPSAG